jgi:uncharacterized membrane protein YhaH (DUF805 family)
MLEFPDSIEKGTGQPRSTMDFLYLFTSFQGRISRAQWWAGTSILFVVSHVIGTILTGFLPLRTGAILVTLVYLALFPLGYAVAAKRFQDRDKPGVTALYGLIPGLVAALLPVYGLAGSLEDPNALGYTCAIIVWTMGLWFIIELGFLKGTSGPNRFSGDRSDAMTTYGGFAGSRIIGGRLAAHFAAAAGAVIIIVLYNSIIWMTSVPALVPLFLLSKNTEKWAEPGFLFYTAVLLIALGCALSGFLLATPLARLALRVWPVDPFGGWTVRKKFILIFGILCLIPSIAFFSLTFIGLLNYSTTFAREYPSSQRAYVRSGDYKSMLQYESMLQQAVVRLGWSSILLGGFCIFYWAHLRAANNLGRPFVLFLRRFSDFADRSLVADIIKSMPKGIPLAFIASRSDQVKNWDPFLWAIGGLRLLNPLRNLPIQIKTTDENWIETVEKLLQKTYCVVIDISDRSPSIEMERRLIGKYISQDCVVALVDQRRMTDESADQPIRSGIRYIPSYWNWNSAVMIFVKVGIVLAIWLFNYKSVWGWVVLLLLPFLFLPSVSRKERGEIRSAVLSAVRRYQERRL